MQQMQMHPQHMPPHMGYQYQPQVYQPPVYQPQAPRQVSRPFCFGMALQAQGHAKTDLSQPSTTREQHLDNS
jgi:hypothetical protein